MARYAGAGYRDAALLANPLSEDQWSGLSKATAAAMSTGHYPGVGAVIDRVARLSAERDAYRQRGAYLGIFGPDRLFSDGKNFQGQQIPGFSHTCGPNPPFSFNAGSNGMKGIGGLPTCLGTSTTPQGEAPIAGKKYGGVFLEGFGSLFPASQILYAQQEGWRAISGQGAAFGGFRPYDISNYPFPYVHPSQNGSIDGLPPLPPYQVAGPFMAPSFGPLAPISQKAVNAYTGGKPSGGVGGKPLEIWGNVKGKRQKKPWYKWVQWVMRGLLYIRPLLRFLGIVTEAMDLLQNLWDAIPKRHCRGADLQAVSNVMSALPGRGALESWCGAPGGVGNVSDCRGAPIRYAKPLHFVKPIRFKKNGKWQTRRKTNWRGVPSKYPHPFLMALDVFNHANHIDWCSFASNFVTDQIKDFVIGTLSNRANEKFLRKIRPGSPLGLGAGPAL